MAAKKEIRDPELRNLRDEMESEFPFVIRKLAREILASLPENQTSIEGMLSFTGEIVRCATIQLIFAIVEARAEAAEKIENEQSLTN
ncbi:hypothetical protein L0244_19950 [bacterium]|nr:hypothetical protein [bacterium]